MLPSHKRHAPVPSTSFVGGLLGARNQKETRPSTQRDCGGTNRSRGEKRSAPSGDRTHDIRITRMTCHIGAKTDIRTTRYLCAIGAFELLECEKIGAL